MNWQQVVESSPACQGYLQSSITEPTYLLLHHSSIGTVLYLSLVDHLIQKLNDRLFNHNDQFPVGQYLIPTQLGSLKRETTNNIYNASTTRSFGGKRDGRLPRGEEPNNLEDTLSCTSEDLYSNVATVLTILLIMPVSTATPERSFSTKRKSENIRAVHYADRATIILCTLQGDAD